MALSGLQMRAQNSATSTNPQIDNTIEKNNGSSIYADFPQYKDTVNQTEDAKRYENAKADWIANHPEEYKNMNKINSSIQITMVDLPGFPVYLNTGNTRTDIENYKIAKDKWIIEHQELYNKYLETLYNNSEHTTEKK